jgi:hypothetical protein
VLLPDDRETLALMNRAIGMLGVGETELVAELHSLRFWVAVLATEFSLAIESVETLRSSPSAYGRIFGNASLAWLVGLSDFDRGRELLDAASSVLPTIGRQSDADRAGQVINAMTAEVLLAAGHVAESRDVSLASLGIWALDDDECSGQVSRALTVCNLLLGDPGSALAAAEGGSFVRSAFGPIDFHAALCHIVRKDLDQAVPLLRDLAHRSVSGRVRMEAGTVLLLLAELARVEGDDQAAREFLLVSTMPRTADLLAYARHLAEALGVGLEYRDLRADQSKGDITWHDRHHLECIAAVRIEMARRGWDD